MCCLSVCVPGAPVLGGQRGQVSCSVVNKYTSVPNGNAGRIIVLDKLEIPSKHYLHY